MSVNNLPARGFGPSAAIKFVATRGYSIGVAIATAVDVGGKARAGAKRKRFRNADEELTEAEVQFMRRKLNELKKAKTEREKEIAAKELEVALAQAAQDEEAAQVITKTIEERKPEAVARADYGPVMRDIKLLTQITNQLDRIVKEAAIRQRDEDDTEILLLMA